MQETPIEKQFFGLCKIGRRKPIACITDSKMAGRYFFSAQTHSRIASALGLKTMWHKCAVMAPVGDTAEENREYLYIYAPRALRRLLNKPSSRSILKKYHWPAEPEAFIKKLGSTRAMPKSDLYTLIADAFGDFKNAWRNDVTGSEDMEKAALAAIEAHIDHYAAPAAP